MGVGSVEFGGRDKVERVMGDGTKVAFYRNGTRKETFADGEVLVRFGNGDVKRTLPMGTVPEEFADVDGMIPLSEIVSAGPTVIYFYAKAETLHGTFASGVEVYRFPSGQIECHANDGSKVICFPDGTKKTVFPDGSSESVFNDGYVVREPAK